MRFFTKPINITMTEKYLNETESFFLWFNGVRNEVKCGSGGKLF